MKNRSRDRAPNAAATAPKPRHTGARSGPADFSAPWEFTELDLAFPTNTLAAMPKYEDVASFRGRFDRLFADWFYWGLSSLKGTPKPGIDANKAFAHVRFIMGGFDSKHEHKEAAVRFLLDKWFESIVWTTGTP